MWREFGWRWGSNRRLYERLPYSPPSSLQRCLGEPRVRFEEQNGGADVSTSFAGSSELLATDPTGSTRRRLRFRG